MSLLLGYLATFLAGVVFAVIIYRLAVSEHNRQKTETEQEWLDRQW